MFFSIVYKLQPFKIRILSETSSADEQILADCRSIVSDQSYTPKDPSDLCHRLLYTCYMGTENSSEETKLRAAGLASEINANHSRHLAHYCSYFIVMMAFPLYIFQCNHRRHDKGYIGFFVDGASGNTVSVASISFQWRIGQGEPSTAERPSTVKNGI